MGIPWNAREVLRSNVSIIMIQSAKLTTGSMPEASGFDTVPVDLRKKSENSIGQFCSSIVALSGKIYEAMHRFLYG